MSRADARLYRLFLAAYPRAFRGRYGAEMARAFAADRERAARRRGGLGVAVLWAKTLADTASGAVLTRMATGPDPGRAATDTARAAMDPGRAAMDPGRAAVPVGGPAFPVHPPPRRKEAREMLDDLVQDLRYGARSLAKTPGFTAVAILILALGIGADSTIFSLVRALFLSTPPAVAEPQRLVRVTLVQNGAEPGWLGYPDYRYYRDHNQVLEGLTAYSPDGVPLSLGGGGRQVSGWLVSGNYFEVLGVRPAAGRFFRPEEDEEAGAYPVVVVSHDLWRQELGASPEAVGEVLTLNGHPYTVVGVAPEGFQGIGAAEAPPDLWLPIHMQPVVQPSQGDWLRREPGRRVRWLLAVGRLAPGVGVEAAQANLSAVYQSMVEEYPGWHEDEGIAVSRHYRFHPPVRHSFLTLVGLLGAVVALVLIIACANLAILLLARGSARRRQLWVRAALGAARGRVVRQLLTESLLLALAGGLLGFVLAHVGTEVAAALLPADLAVDLRPDLAVFGFTLALAAVTAVLFGGLPALQASHVDAAEVLRSGASGGRRSLLRSSLVVVQVTLSIAVISGAGLLVRSLVTASTLDLGFSTERRLVASLSLANHGYDEVTGRELVEQAVERLQVLPGVRSVSYTVMVPFQGHWSGSLGADGATPPPDQEDFQSGFNAVGPGYFRTLGIPIVAGREIEPGDRRGAPQVAVINQAAATMLWPGEDPRGRWIDAGEDTGRFQVVGVARDATYYEPGEAPQPQVYLPFLQAYWPRVSLLVETEGEPAAQAEAVRGENRALTPVLAFSQVLTFEELYGDEIGRYRVAAELVSLFGLLALVLAATGLYGVLSYLVVQRTREIGVRVALGATRQRVARAVLGSGLRLTLVGAALGVALALASAGLLRSFLFGVSPRDPATFLLTPVLLVLVAGLAALVPARRATRVDPVVALRAE